MVNDAKQNRTAEELIEGTLDLFILPTDFDYGNFHAIPEEKQQTIIEAAIEEFATKGYRLASTNEIVKNAGISKGILFRYFGNKSNLYLYLVNHVSEIVIKEVSEGTNFDTDDIIDLLMNAAHVKVETAIRHPLEMKLYRDMFNEDLPESMTGFMHQVLGVGYKMMTELLALTDDSMLKDGFEKEEVLSVVNWVLVGLSEEIIKSDEIGNTREDYETYLQRVEKYMDLMKSLFYKRRT
jgi:AcrR family transcriptional regulator